jgi:MinD-like ATPase involved in chromosome partitioning or flagellar assembly
MTTVASVLTTKDGQGSTGFALSIAWTAAAERGVLLIDADMSGTGTVADAVALDFSGHGIGNLFGTLAITASMLEEQAVQVKGRPRLRIVAGLQGFPGPDVAELLPRLGPALQSVTAELVVLDLGAPLAHPGQESPRRTAEAIAGVSQRVFVVIHDSPARLVKSIQVLKAAQLPQAELVINESRRGALRAQVRRALAEHLPGLPVSATRQWDERKAAQAEDKAQPPSVNGLLDVLKL